MALQQDTNRQLIQQRLRRFRLPVLLVFMLLGARLWHLQIIKGAEYTIRAERNRVRRVPLVAARGAILDRYGTPLVENRPSFDVLLYREDIRDREETERFIVEKLGIPQESLERLLSRNQSAGLYQPIVIKEDVGMEEISIIEVHRQDHPEIRLGPEPRRLYHYGKLAAHLLGYLGEISQDELNSGDYPDAVSGSLIGRSGVERSYNRALTGRDGVRQVMVDSRGREVGLLDEIPYVSGSEVRLTLDLDLQKIAEDALEGKVGAVVAMDPRNGEILTMASAPAFDPNSFSPRISSAAWNAIMNDPDRPMQNRTIQNSYHPGSIFKLIMASAGMHEGALDDNPGVLCTGSAVYYGRSFRCASTHGHGVLHLEQAIAKSCNIFFYELGRRLGINKIAEHAESLGMGSRTGIDLAGERSGVMPSPEWKERVQKAKWYVGETISVAIGQGAVESTPIQMLRAVSAIATGGELMTPHVLLHAEAGDEREGNWPTAKLDLRQAHVRRIREGMWESVNAGGTGRNALVPGRDICGKTGTVQVVGREKKQLMRSNSENHAWFAGFASRDNPEIAVVVFIEHGGGGGAAAAPIAKEIFKAYYEKKYPSPPVIEDRVVNAVATNSTITTAPSTAPPVEPSIEEPSAKTDVESAAEPIAESAVESSEETTVEPAAESTVGNLP